ncbi:hypothetical protein [Geoalkalibacter sp.]|uniref:hypothetical protein n=1 Tax=Geoalkalibacter sp. TaxID=3041440 RepID=UPI00272DDB64|nr:hypothetical protein [Geoalkalibacter sp.]
MHLDHFKTSLAEMAALYRLPPVTVLDTIERTMSEVLSSRYRGEDIQVRIDERTLEIRILAFSMLNGGTWRDIPEANLSGIKNLHRHIQGALQRASVVREVKKIRKHCNKVSQGVVTRIDRDGSLYVEFDLGPQQGLVTGHCPSQNLPRNERGRYLPGEERYFHLASCTPVMVGQVPRIRLTLDRTSKRLPEQLLAQWFENAPQDLRITCRMRQPGERSEIWTTHKIPKQTLTAVSKELGEHVFILIGKNGVEIRKARRSLFRRRKEKQLPRELEFLAQRTEEIRR